MFAYIEGRIEAKERDHIVLQVGPIGYLINCDLQMLARFPQVGETCRIYTYQHVREDAIMLYGFPSPVEKNLFEQVITVTGIGPKLGASIVAGLDPAQLVMAIMNNDLKSLSSIKGVGKKTAQRLVLELKDKLKDFGGELEDLAGELIVDSDDQGLAGEAISALQMLGYSRSEVEPLIQAIMASRPDLVLEDVIRLGLKSLAKV